MTTTYLGGKSVGEVVPSLPLALSQVSSLLAPQSAKASDIAGRLALPFTPPDPLPLLTALENQIASLASTLAQLPTLDASARISLAADLLSLQSLIGPAQDLVATLGGALSTGGIHAYAVEARTGQIGVELTGALVAGVPGGGGPNATAKALVLVTESPTAWAALSGVLRTR